MLLNQHDYGSWNNQGFVFPQPYTFEGICNSMSYKESNSTFKVSSVLLFKLVHTFPYCHIGIPLNESHNPCYGACVSKSSAKQGCNCNWQCPICWIAHVKLMLTRTVNKLVQEAISIFQPHILFHSFICLLMLIFFSCSLHDCLLSCYYWNGAQFSDR